jgi:hypothetical protein
VQKRLAQSLTGLPRNLTNGRTCFGLSIHQGTGAIPWRCSFNRKHRSVHCSCDMSLIAAPLGCADRALRRDHNETSGHPGIWQSRETAFPALRVLQFALHGASHSASHNTTGIRFKGMTHNSCEYLTDRPNV